MMTMMHPVHAGSAVPWGLLCMRAAAAVCPSSGHCCEGGQARRGPRGAWVRRYTCTPNAACYNMMSELPTNLFVGCKPGGLLDGRQGLCMMGRPLA